MTERQRFFFGVATASVLMWLAPCFATILSAERLPARAYTTSDGLELMIECCARCRIHVASFRFCTAEGLSRFDWRSLRELWRGAGPAGAAGPRSDRDAAGRLPGRCTRRAGAFRRRCGSAFSSQSSWELGGRALRDDAVCGVLTRRGPARRPVVTLLRDRAGQVWAGGAGGLFRVDESTDGFA